MAAPGIGVTLVQEDSSWNEFPLLMQLAWGGTDVTLAAWFFFHRYDYYSITVFRDISIPVFSMLSDHYLRTTRTSDPSLLRDTTFTTFRSSATTHEQYANLLLTASQTSRGGLLLDLIRLKKPNLVLCL